MTSQVRFIKGISAVANTRKVLAALEHSKQNPNRDIIIVTLDAEKAFYNVSLTWLFEIMENMGFKGPILHTLREMYESPKARVLTPRVMSEPMRLYRKTRQGWPLFPLLYNIAMEPLSRYINATDKLQGIQIGSQMLKIALFADDVLLFLAKPETDSQTSLRNMVPIQDLKSTTLKAKY